MASKCFDCPRTKDFIKLDGSPCCGAKDFYMDVNTHIAECPICKTQWGVSMIVEGLCYQDKLCKRYSLSVVDALSKKQILEFSKLIQMSGVDVYHLFKAQSPVEINNIPMILAYKLQKYFNKEEINIVITPALKEYHLFEKCWNI